MEALVEKAKEVGGDGISFSQGKYLNGRPGVCRALCLKWIKHHSRGASLLEKLSAGEEIALKRWKSIEKLQANEKPRNERITPGTYLVGKKIDPFIKPEMALAWEMGTVCPDLAVMSKFSKSLGELITNVVQIWSGKEAMYKLIHLSATGSISEDGHQCAAYVREEEIIFFDPNVGEYRFPQDQIWEWFPTYWVLSGNDAAYKRFKVDEYGPPM